MTTDKETPNITWDTCQLAMDESKRLVEEGVTVVCMICNQMVHENEARAHLIEHNPYADTCNPSAVQGFFNDLDEDTAFHLLCNDPLFMEDRWDQMTDELGEHMHSLNADGRWYIEARRVGWRHLSGSKTFSTDNPASFLCEIMDGIGDYTFKMYMRDDHMHFVVYTHDNPTGFDLNAYKAIECDLCGSLHSVQSSHQNDDGYSFCPDCWRLREKEMSEQENEE